MRVVWLIAFVACGRAPDSDAALPEDSETTTGTDGGIDSVGSPPLTVPVAPQVLSVSCTQQPTNVLRFDCEVVTDLPGPVDVRILDSLDATVATFGSDAETSVHDVGVWGLTASSSFTAEAWATATPAVLASTPFVTTVLPADVDLAMVVTGSGTTGPVLFNWTCVGNEHLVVADPTGQVVWYQALDELDVAAVVSRGFSVTPEETVLVLADRYHAVELDWTGQILWETLPGELPDPAHHDVQRADGLTYVLDANSVSYADGNDYVMDGFRVFDESGLVASWTTDGLVDPLLAGPSGGGYWTPIWPTANDWAHANALGPDGAGNLIISHKEINTLQKIVSDPADLAFGDIVWTLVGKSSPLPGDLTLISSVGITPLGFGDQHHVSVLPGGDILMVDNQPAGGIDSRVIRLVIDEVAGTADLVEVWDFGRDCPGQGSAFLLPSGDLLTDCAKDRTLREIETGTDAVLWSMTPSCITGAPPRPLYRAVPVPASFTP